MLLSTGVCAAEETAAAARHPTNTRHPLIAVPLPLPVQTSYWLATTPSAFSDLSRPDAALIASAPIGR
jgi:hypothetical protein